MYKDNRMITNKIFSDKCTQYILLLILGLAIALAFQVLHAPFFLDDIPQIEHVNSFSSPKEIFSPDTFGLKRPAKNLIFWLVLQTGTHAVITAHSILLTLYIATIFILFFWFRLWTPTTKWAAIGTGIWALSPTLVSSIAWLSCANILVSMISVLAGLICWEYARHKQEKAEIIKSYVLFSLSIIFYALAFSAYEAIIIFPCLIVIQDIMIKRRSLSKKIIMPYLALTIITLILLLARGKLTPMGNSCIIGVTKSWQLQFASPFFMLSHIKLWLWPFASQEIMRTFIWGKTTSMLLLTSAWILPLVLGVATIKLYRQYPEIIAGIAWSIISLIPMCNIIPLYSGPFADYYMTLSSVGLSLSIIFIIKNLLDFLYSSSILRSHKIIAITVLIIIISSRTVGVISTFTWTQAWNNNTILLQRSIHAHKFAFHAQAELARLLTIDNQLEYAEELAINSLNGADDFILPRNVLGDIKRKQGHFNESEKWYKKVLHINSQNMYAHISLANLYNDNLNNKELAKQHFLTVINYKQNNQYRETAYINLSIIFGIDGKYDQAITLLNKALLEFPESKALHNNLKVTTKLKNSK